MGSNSSGYDVVVKLHAAPGRVSSSMKLQQAAAAAAPGPPGCCRSSPSSSYLQTQNQSRSLGVASSEIVQLHHHRHHHHLHGSLSLQADDDPESLMPSEFNKQLVSKTTSFHIPESGTFPLTFAPGTYFHRDRRWRSPFSITQLRASSSSRRSLHHSWNLAWILTKCMQRTHSLQTDCSNSPCFASNDSTVEEEEEEGSSSVFIGRHQSSRIMHCTCCCGCWRSESDFCCCGLWVGACFLSFFLVCVCARAQWMISCRSRRHANHTMRVRILPAWRIWEMWWRSSSGICILIPWVSPCRSVLALLLLLLLLFFLLSWRRELSQQLSSDR